MITECDECQTTLTLTDVYSDGDLIGAECPDCGYWVSRYTEDEDDEPHDDGYYYSGSGEWSNDDSYIDYLNNY